MMKNLPNPILAGVSGGADSVALLMLLRDAGLDVTAVHVDHALRGEASDGDAAFVRELCAKYQVPLRIYRAEPPAHPSEDWARQVRYGFYRQAAQETGVGAIALAHHRDDQAETLLLHLLRGAGLTGLTAMKPDVTADGLRILRPLLGYSREELRQLLTARGQPWREDASNQDVRYLRNALRRDVLPLLEQLAPGASARLAQTAQTLSADEAVLAQLTEAFLQAHGGRPYLPLTALQAQLPGLQKRILRAWWMALDGSVLTASQTEALQGLIQAPAGAQCNLPGGLHGYRGWTHLHITGCAEMPAPETPVGESGLIRIEAWQGEPGDGKGCQAIPRRMLEGCVIRMRKIGDRIRPFGSCGEKKLQDYLTDRRVDAPFRDRVPLLCRGSEVLLVGGVGAGAVPRITKEDDPVLLTWRDTFPWQTG